MHPGPGPSRTPTGPARCPGRLGPPRPQAVGGPSGSLQGADPPDTGTDIGGGSPPRQNLNRRRKPAGPMAAHDGLPTTTTRGKLCLNALSSGYAGTGRHRATGHPAQTGRVGPPVPPGAAYPIKRDCLDIQCRLSFALATCRTLRTGRPRPRMPPSFCPVPTPCLPVPQSNSKSNRAPRPR